MRKKRCQKSFKMEVQNLFFKETYRKLVEVMLSLSVADIAGKVCHLLQSCSCIQVQLGLKSENTWVSLRSQFTRAYHGHAMLHHYNKLELNLTQENVISVALWIHLGPASGPPPFAIVLSYTPFQSNVLPKHELGCK